MNRRKFINRAVLTASAIPTVSFLSACGSGSSNSQQATNTGSGVTKLVSSLQSEKESSDSLHDNSSNNIAVSSAPSLAAARILLSPSRTTTHSRNFFANRKPNSSYLSDTTSVWDDYASYNNLSYKQFTNQYTKLTAALRLYEYKKDKASTNTVADQALASARAQLSPKLASTQKTLDKLVDSVSKNITASSLDSVAILLGLFQTTLEGLESTEGTLYALATYISLDKLLEAIKDRAVSDLDFTNNENIMLSLAKMSIAAISLMGVMSLEKFSQTANLAPSLSTSNSDSTKEIEAYLSTISIQSSLTMIMMELMSSYVTGTNQSVQNIISELTQSAGNLTSDEEEKRDTLMDKLKGQSTIMAIVGVVMKALYAMVSTKAVDSMDSAFNTGSDASEFAILFTSDTLPQDANFTAFMSDLQTSLESGADFGTIFALISSMKTNFQTTPTDTAASADAEEAAFTFASLLSNDAYEFTSQTETHAYDFATYMAGLAYDFTMKIEDDAYNFAMQGMEYGYLFASQGEDVGVMADRILWMAVQIGQMADRIGEMADRIVYTETLIVYTEMLILDFGLLIYGGMKMITNLMLSGMAIILDREWYENDSEDQIVTLIGENMTKMMKNMQSYSMAVLKNQDDLREVTLSALDWVGTNTATQS